MSAQDLENVIRRLSKLRQSLTTARWAALKREVDPLVAAYRSRGSRDAKVLGRILSLLRRHELLVTVESVRTATKAKPPTREAILKSMAKVRARPPGTKGALVQHMFEGRRRSGRSLAGGPGAPGARPIKKARMVMGLKPRRSALTSSAGRKLYAVRDIRGATRSPDEFKRPSRIGLVKKAKKAMGLKPPRPVPKRAAKKKGGGGGGRRPAEVVVTARPTRPPRSKAAKAESGPRWVQARVFDLTAADSAKPTPAFRAQGRHAVDVIIAANQRGWLVARGRDASESIDNQLEPGTHELAVVLFIPELGVHQKGTLALPPSGPTPEPARFTFKAGKIGTTLTAFISIVHRGRVLQTAVLRGKVVADPGRASTSERISLQLQEVVSSLAQLDQREPFDATLLTATGKDAATVATAVTQQGRGAAKSVPFRQPGIDGAARRIRDILATVVTDESPDEGLDAKPARDLLCQLAQEGRLLYEKVGQPLEKALAGRELSRLQLVQADPDAFIPMEFAYSLPVPASGASLCRNWKGALAGKPCSDEFHPLDALQHLKVVCPSGFWAVSKVIERQVFADPRETRRDADFELQADPGAARQSLPAIKGAVFAWSEKLDNAVDHTSQDLLKVLQRATGNQVDGVTTWLDWAKAIGKRRPQLLVVMSHTVDGALEIGPEDGGDRSTLAQINELYVKKDAADAPIVFLLGCTTAVADNQFESFVSRFREKGAAIVVGTITPVLGERSAAVVEAVVDELIREREGSELFGEVLRSARRKLLLKGRVTALCATSFGDASWFVN